MKKGKWVELINSGRWAQRVSRNWDLFHEGERVFLTYILPGPDSLSLKEACAEIGICRATAINAIKRITKKMEDAYV